MGRSSGGMAAGQAVVGVLMVVCAVLGPFPAPVPLLFLIGAAGSANAAFQLMRSFGSALLGGVATMSVALAPVPFTTCAAAKFTAVFPCAGDAPTWHLTGAVIAAGLSGAGLVLARLSHQGDQLSRLAGVERQVAALRQELADRTGERLGSPD